MDKKLLVAIVAGCLLSCGQSEENPRNIEKFNENWQFALGADSLEAFTNLTTQPRTLNLPHDWSIEGDFKENNPATPGGGALPGGFGVYQKEFFPSSTDSLKQFFICFDGVYWQSTVYINGYKLGFRPNGYIGFEYNITPYLKYDKKNTLTITADNTNQPNSRWYSGSGIYRNVYLKKVDKNHILEPETFIYTENTSAQQTTLNIETQIQGEGNSELEINIYSPSGQNVCKINEKEYSCGQKIKLSTQIDNPQLWSIESPNIYRAEFKIKNNGKTTDVYSQTFGIRFFNFDADNGFSLNGKAMKINGVCNHHDLGALGAAVNHCAIQRQLQILKDMGCNAIRTSHNPPAKELLDLCDSMGFIVMDEAFDMWAKRKTKYDYAQYFAQWHEQDLSDFIKRDRNHPSVIMWSFGNEILEQWGDINTDKLDIAQANLMFNFAAQLSKNNDSNNKTHVNSMLAIKLADIVKNLDPSRPVTTGNNETEPFNLLFKSGAMDIIGFNYHEYNWGKAFKEKFPNKPLIITEAVSALQTRGNYIAPADSEYLWPERWDLPFDRPDHQCSAYDNTRTPWGTSHETTLKEYMKYPWVSGIFVWTGFDYIGEPTPYGWPSRSSYFGIIDLAGFPKDVYYLYQSLWTSKPVLHLLPHWNWQEGEKIDVWAYTNLEEVELFLNGQTLGKQTAKDDKLHLAWKVDYQPGELKAIAKTKDGQTIEDVVCTADTAASISITADRNIINADGEDLSFVTIEIMDKNGVLVPTANNMIQFAITGPGEIIATDNGDPTCHEKFTNRFHSAFNGKCLCIVRSQKDKKGEIVLTAKSNNINEAEIKIMSK